MNYRDARVLTKILFAGILIIIGFVAIMMTSYQTINQIKISSNLYDEAVLTKDAVADVLPPPEYIIESIFTVYQIVTAPDESTLDNRIEYFSKLENEYVERHQFWVEEFPKHDSTDWAELENAMLIESYEPAIEFYDVVNNKVIPAMKAGDKETAMEITLTTVEDLYKKQRKGVDNVVSSSTELYDKILANSENIIKIKNLQILIVSILTLVISFGATALIINKTVVQKINKLEKAAKAIADGDLTVGLDKDMSNSKDELGNLSRSFIAMISNLKDLVGNMKDNAFSTASSSEKLSASAKEVNSSMEQVSSTIQEVAKGAQVVSKGASESQDSSKKTSESAQEGSKSASEVNNKMSLISTSIKESSTKMKLLGDKSKEIGNIIETINNISEQTNLLALNAAIEAARAGDAGRGFAVVADEVRKLAEESGKATGQISELIGSIQVEIKESVESMEKSTSEVEEGAKAVQDALKSFESIPKLVDAVNKSLSEMAAVAEENAAGSEEVSSSVEEVTSAMQEVSTSAQNLSKGAEELKRIVSKFKIR